MNIARVRATIAAAAGAAARRAQDVMLVAVSKTQPVAAVQSALDAGLHAFGESTVQESLQKIGHFEGVALEWHFIGHLQSNKAKFLPGVFSWVHSLDSVRLANRLSEFAAAKNVHLNALLEVNIAHDPKKHGIPPEQVFSLLEELLRADLPGIRLRGLMAIGPYPADESQSRDAYARVRVLRDQCRQRFGLHDFTELSMGMSGDYAAAIKEGSTMVRVGTAIFGARNYRAV